jgi:hypothetical protein
MQTLNAPASSSSEPPGPRPRTPVSLAISHDNGNTWIWPAVLFQTVLDHFQTYLNPEGVQIFALQLFGLRCQADRSGDKSSPAQARLRRRRLFQLRQDRRNGHAPCILLLWSKGAVAESSRKLNVPRRRDFSDIQSRDKVRKE